MWYLSKIELRRDLSARELGRAIPANGYAEHQVIWKLASGGRDEPRDFLFRRDQVGQWPTFFLLAPREPSAGSYHWTIQSKPYAPKLKDGQRLAFALRANPVRSRHEPRGERGGRRIRDDRIMDAKRQEQELDPSERSSQAELVQREGPSWLRERAEANGFAVEALCVDDYRQHRLYKRGSAQPIQFSTLDYQGVLSVTDPDLLLTALQKGIGPAKAFGCGLLLVRRVE